MRFVTHLIAADVRHHRALIALSLVFLIAATVVDGLHPLLGGDAGVRSPLVLLGWVLWILKLIVRIVLIARVVHSHPLVGSDAFWLTRPIPPRTLLVAKTILLVCTVVVAPVIAEASLMARHEVPPMTLLGVAADATLSLAAVLAVLMAAASVTPTFSRFALLCVGTLASLALYLAIQIAISSARPSARPPGVPAPPSPPDATVDLVLLVTATAAFAVVLLVQYRTRSRLRAFLVAAAGVIAVPMVTSAWPWPVLEARTELPAWATPGSAFRLTVNETLVGAVSPTASDGSEWRRLVAPVGSIGMDDSWSASAGLIEATLQLDNGTTLRSVPDAFPRPLATGGNELDRHALTRRLLGVRSLSGNPPPFPEAVTLLLVREQDAQRHVSSQGRYHGRFHVQLTRHQIEAALPLTPGASGGHRPYRVAIDRVAFPFGNLELRLRESDASSSFDRRPGPSRRFFVRNRRTSEAVEGRLGDFDPPLLPVLRGFSFSSDQSGFHTANIGLRFNLRLPGDGPQIDASWLQTADLVIVTSTPERAIERTIDIAPFRLER